MRGSIVLEDIGKRYEVPGIDRPSSFKELLLSGGRIAKRKYFWGLRHLTFEIPSGRAVGIVGRNGAGKSTLLRLIGGVGQPDEGRLHVNGRVGALLDLGAGLTDDLTGRENIFITGVIAGMTRREVQQRFDQIVAFAELEEFIDRPIRMYSTGMRMRLAFAVASHIDPDILLIDEVLAVGDVAFQRKCMERIAKIKASGCTILLVSHAAEQVRALCDEVVLLKQGSLAAMGPTNEMLEIYESSVVASHEQEKPNIEVEDTELGDGRLLRMNVNRFGSQDAQIQEVKILNGHRFVTDSVSSGGGLLVRLRFKPNVAVRSPRVSVSICAPDGTICFDSNSEASAIDLGVLEQSTWVELEIERLDLTAGRYFVNVGLYEESWEYSYDRHVMAYPLNVLGPVAGKGLLQPPLRWSASATEEALI